MATFAETAARLAAFEDSELGGGVGKAALDAAEQALGIRITGGYRSFLERFGWGGVEHIELFGLGDDVPSHLDLVTVTRSERSEATPALPVHLVPVMNDGGGNLLCLDTRSGDEPAVVFWDHEEDAAQTPSVEAASFADWLTEMLDDLG